METLLSRYRNVSILMAILFAQVLGLAVQVRRAKSGESNRLIRVWAVATMSPLERAILWVQDASGNLWKNYVYLRGVRQQNRDLRYEIENLRLEQVRLREDANQARRLQALLEFKEQYVAKTVAAQVIGSTGSEHSRAVYIDKGSADGIQNDMAVITAEGVVGKVWQVYDRHTSLVLLINDQSSGVGAILAKSRLHGILRGTPAGEVVLEKVLWDEQVQPGEQVITSGGDQVFPKGLPAGVVTSVSRGPDTFLNIRIRPAANLGKLEEVLVITKKEHLTPSVSNAEPARAADILAQRLPSVPDQPAGASSAIPLPTSGLPPGPGPTRPGDVSEARETNGRFAPPASSVPATLDPGQPAERASRPPRTAAEPVKKEEKSAPRTVRTNSEIRSSKPAVAPAIPRVVEAPGSTVKPAQTAPPQDRPQ